MKTKSRGFLVIALAILAAGCFAHEERITVLADGSVIIRVVHEADSDAELYETDAAPTAAGGWSVEPGEEPHSLTAIATFAAGATLPDGFADPRDPLADLYVRFPTEVKVEERTDGTYYHFRRVYPRRNWARVRVLQKELENELRDEIDLDKDVDELTPEEIIDATRIFVRYYHLMELELIELAFRDLYPDGPQDRLLALRGYLEESLERGDYSRLAAAIAGAEDPEAVFEAFMERIEEQRDERAGAALAAAGESNPERTAAFMDRYAWYVHRVDVMQNETFEISVEMPGEIIGSNAESVEGGTATWNFRAGDLGYGDVELMVSSFIATEPAR